MATNTLDHSVINFDIYEDGVDYYGMAKVTLPQIAYKTTTLSGAGIGGDIESVIFGMIDAMTMKMEFRTMTKAAMKLNELRRHILDIRPAIQQENLQSGLIEIPKYKSLPSSRRGLTLALSRRQVSRT